MSIVNISHLYKAYGSQVLLEDVSLSLNKSARIGLIGRNGEGKSTLLKAIAGLVDIDDGEVNVRKGMRVAYLQQDPYFEAGQTVFHVVAEGLGDAASILQAYHQALQGLHENASPSQLQRLDALQAELEHLQAWGFHSRIGKAISRLKLDANRDVAELSGGWLRRVALAQAVVAEPDLLLLDEPTNHLDIDSIEWLEDFVASFQGGVLFITHDRYFLDAVAEEIIELDRGKIERFPCGYAEYLEKKAAMLAAEESRNRKFDQLLAGEEQWIRRGIPARRRRDEGRVRALEDLRKQRAARRLRAGDVELRVASGIKPGKMLIEAVEISHAFGDTTIAKNFSHKIMAGDRLGLLGVNGIGKTTLLKMLLGQLKPQQGRIRHGVRLAPAFLTQMRDIDRNLKLKDVLLPNGGQYVHIGGHEPRHIISYLQDFLFDKERLNSKVSALSGGERGRLLLAKLLLEPANVLVLDEPTNDLDIGTLAVLEQALAGYNGTVIIVSHDRAFMDRVVTRLLAFEGDGEIIPIAGGYSDYQAWKERQQQRKDEKKPLLPPKKEKRQNSLQIKQRLSYKDQRELDSLPQSIEVLEGKKADIERRFCDAAYFNHDPQAYQQDVQQLKMLEEQLLHAYQRWEELESLQ